MDQNEDACTEASSDLYRGLGSAGWDPLLDEAARERQRKKKDDEEKHEMYGSFEDTEHCFPDDDQQLKLPSSLTGIDRVEVTSQLQERRKKENDALLAARVYRDKCTHLQQQCRQLKTEKEAIRYFWRNKLLEGHSRGGRLVSMAINNGNTII